MASNAMRPVQAFQWQQQQQRPADEPEERDIAVDPFSLRQFSRLDIDRPLPIPSVSVADPHVSSPSPAHHRLVGSRSSPAVSAASSPRVSIAGRLNALAEATGWDADAWSASCPAQNVVVPSVAPLPIGDDLESSAAAGGETTELADNAVLSLSGRKASEPQRWGSDVPLIAAAAGAEEDSDSAARCYSFPNARGIGKNNGRRGTARRAGGGETPFRCCMYVPGLTRRGSSKLSTAVPELPRSASSGAFSRAGATAMKQQQYQYQCTDDPGPGAARQSTVSLAVSLERFDCGSLSTSSWGDDLDLDGGEVSSSAYFDLPLELIMGGGDETDMPVCAAFVFDSDAITKGVVKNRMGDGVGEAPRPSMGRRVSTDASGRSSATRVRVSVKSRAPLASASP